MAVSILAVLGMSLAGCGTSGSDSTETGDSKESSYQKIDFAKKEPLKIGYSTQDLSNPYWQNYAKGVEAGAKDAGAEVTVLDSKMDQSKQVSNSLDLINQSISGLIVTPVQPDALPSTIDAAHEEKIPVVIGDIGTSGDYDAYLLSNNEEGGKQAATYLTKKLTSAGTHKIGVIELHAGSVVGEQRRDGFKEEIAKHENFKIVSSLDGKDSVDGGFKAAQDMLSANPDLEAIYAANDNSAVGAQRAMEAAGKSVADGFVLLGFDGNDQALQMIKDGRMTATVAQDPYAQGKKAVEIVLKLLNKENPQFDDSKDRTVLYPVSMVDKDNLSEFQATKAKQN
jgi:ribose transport system substrate-binding protein